MTDYSKFKAQAEIDESCNERFTQISPSELLELIAENEALIAEKEKSFADGRFRGLDEAQNLCYQMALGEYRPDGSRYTLFTPKKERMLGDVLVKACNAIADLPDGPYERMRIKREQKSTNNAPAREKCQHGTPSKQSCFDCIGILHGNKP